MIIKLTYRYPDDPPDQKVRVHIGNVSKDDKGLGIWIHTPKKGVLERELIFKEWISRCVETRT